MSSSVISTDVALAKTELVLAEVESRPPAETRPSPVTYPALIMGLTAAALVLRLLFLGRDSLWVDEAATAAIASEAWARLEELLSSSCSVMALYYLIVHAWTSIAGTSEFALRFPSAVFSVLTVPVLYLLGAELFDRRTGALAAALMAINANAIGFGQDARAYALLVLLVTVSALFFVRALRRPSLTNCAGYVVFGVLSVYAQLFAILVLPAEWLSLSLFKRGRKAIVPLTASAVIFGLLAIPAFAVAIRHGSGVTLWIPRTSVYAVLQFFAIEAGHFQLVHFQGYLRAVYLIAGFLLAVLYAVAIIAALRLAASGGRYPNQIAFVALCAFVPVVITILVSLVKPLFIDRYLIECQPFFVMLAAAGLMRMDEVIPRRGIFAYMIIVIALFEGCLYYMSPGWEDWRDAVSYVASNAKPGDAAIIYRGDARWGVDYYRDQLKDPAKFPVIVYPKWDSEFRIDGHYIDGEVFNRLDPYLLKALAGRPNRVWLILRDTVVHAPGSSEIVRTVWNRLAHRYRSPEIRKFYGVEVALFGSPKARPGLAKVGTATNH